MPDRKMPEDEQPRRGRRKRSDAELTFSGKALTHDTLLSIWESATEQRKFSRNRILQARGIRLQNTIVQLRPSWVNSHPEAADWVVKVLPERRTLERDLIASVGVVEPYYSRTAIGFLDRDNDAANECENYMEEWRKANVPYQTFAEKGAEDGEFGVVVLPTDVDMEGCPDFYDRLDEDAWADLEDEQRAEYALDEDDPRGRYTRLNEDGSKRPNPKYDRNRSGKKPEKPEDRDDDKSKEAHEEAVKRYLLKQEQGGVTVRVIPALDCAPYLTRGTKRDRWKLMSLVERSLYYPEELIQKGYGWRNMGDRALIPQGFDATRGSGQNGMFYLYTLYMVWVDPDDKRKRQRPIIAYSVGGQPTWNEDVPEGQEAPENGVAILDLYESHGLEGPLWWYGGGLHTSDDDPDFYWEPYLWPLIPTIKGIEGMQTMANTGVASSSTPGYFHRPDAALVKDSSGDLEESLVDSQTLELRKPVVPDAGEIETVVGEVFPAMPGIISPDLWRVIANEMQSLRDNTVLEQPTGAGSQPSGRSMVVKETIAQTAKRQIREAACDAARFCGETAMREFTAIEREFGVCWPIARTKEMPVGSELRAAADILEWHSEWVGDGEYKLTTKYPEERNPVREEIAMGKIERGLGSFEELCEASGITDVESEKARITKTKLWLSPENQQVLMTRMAKRQGNKLMQEVLALQNQGEMTKSAMPGFPAGVPTAALNGPGEGGQTGGPSPAQQSLGGMKAASFGPEMQDAALVAQLPGQGAA